MKKIVHIATDEKFINSAYWQFNEVFPKQNIFYLLVKNRNEKLKHVQLNEDFILIENNLKSVKSLAKKFSNEIIVFHGMDYYKAYLTEQITSNCKTIWMFWGAEIYNNPEIINLKKGLGFYTRTVFKRSTLIKIFKNKYRQLYYRIRFQTNGPDKFILNAIRKIDYCGTFLEDEVRLIKERVNPNIKQFKFSYYPIEFIFNNPENRINANNILIGNSASETNNHLDIFKKLKEFPIKDLKLIVPLSYGNLSYRNKIIKQGELFFGNNFQALVKFVPLVEYNTYLQQCGIVIMNHYRQQAFGNILSMLWMGAKVYLDERNAIYHYLKSIGVFVFSVEKDLIKNDPEIFNLLDFKKQEENREILKAEIGQNGLLEKLQSQLEKLMDEP